MKHLTLTLLSLAVAGALTACGGSSNGGATVPSTPSTPRTNTNTNTNTNANTNNASNTTSNTGATNNTNNRTTPTGNIANITTVTKANNRVNATSQSSNLNNSTYNTLTVGAKTYTIAHPNIISGGFTDTEDVNQEIIASGRHVSYQRYGMVHDKATNQHHLYSMGNRTPVSAVPATGTANYVGRAVHVNFTNNDDSSDGISNFNVNFSNKTITGTITDNDIQGGKVDLRATISGNTFTGNHNGTETTGAFYGANAQELGGTYINNAQQFGGAYGAVKR